MRQRLQADLPCRGHAAPAAYGLNGMGAQWDTLEQAMCEEPVRQLDDDMFDIRCRQNGIQASAQPLPNRCAPQRLLRGFKARKFRPVPSGGIVCRAVEYGRNVRSPALQESK